MKRLPHERRQALVRSARRRHRRRLQRARDVNRPQRIEVIKIQNAFAARYGVARPNDRDRIPILVPDSLSLRGNRSEVVKMIDQLRETVLKRKRRVFLYFDRTTSLEPDAALLLVAECYRCRHLVPSRAGYSVVGNYPKSTEVFHQLRELGFFQLLRVEANFRERTPVRADRPIFLKMLTRNTVDAELAARFCDVVTKGAFAMDELKLTRMVAAIKEAMGNAIEHAYDGDCEWRVMPRRWWMTGHLDIENKEMMVMLLDQGMGIPRKLPPEIYERIKALLNRLSWTPSDGTMIAAATELYRTSTGEGTRGRGFRDMKRFVQSCDDGELRVLSNQGAYAYVNGQETIDDYRQSIGGTLIEWRVRHKSTAELPDG